MRWLIAILLAGSVGCYELGGSSGGGQVKAVSSRHANPDDVALLPGYRIEVVATDLNMPTGVTFDGQGRAYVVEAGYCYGEVFTTPRVLRINVDASHEVIATGDNSGPWNGITF